MSVDDVWGEETWHMNQSEPGSATKDKKSIVTKNRKKRKTGKSHNLEESKY